MSVRGPSSATPILDLSEPLPKPERDGVGPRTMGAILVIIAAGAAFWNAPLLALILGYFVVSLAVAIVHEFGHWMAGAGNRVNPAGLPAGANASAGILE